MNKMEPLQKKAKQFLVENKVDKDVFDKIFRQKFSLVGAVVIKRKFKQNVWHWPENFFFNTNTGKLKNQNWFLLFSFSNKTLQSLRCGSDKKSFPSLQSF